MIDTETTRNIPISISAFSMFMGPGFENFSTSAPNAQQPYSGVSARHEVKLDYQINRKLTLSPDDGRIGNILQHSQSGSDRDERSVIEARDRECELREIRKDDFRRLSLGFDFRAGERQSQQMHEYTGVSVAYLPKLHFRGSRFFLSGVTEAKANFMDNQAQTGLIAPLNLVAGVQCNYRLSPSTTVFVMNHLSANAGPNMGEIMLATPLGQQNPRRKAQTQAQGSNPVTDGIMIGSMFQVLQGVSLAPRLDWSVNQPIGTTTVGVNASFHII